MKGSPRKDANVLRKGAKIGEVLPYSDLFPSSASLRLCVSA